MNKILIPYTPRPIWKEEIHKALETHRFSVLVAHRRFGKTVGVINHILKNAVLTKKPNARYGYIAPYRNQAKSIAWDYLKHYSAVIPGVKFNEGELSVDLPNGSRIRLFGADNAEALRGLYFDGIVLDEVADMKPEVWGEIIRPALSDRKGWAVFIGTPKGQNLFFDLYNQAMSNDEWFAGMYRADQTNVLDEKELNSLRSETSENQFRQEFLCDFTASVDDTLISLDDALAAQSRDYKPPEYDFSPLIFGVDIARFGSDSCCITQRQGLKVLSIKTYKNIDNMRFAGILAGLINELDPQSVFIDAGRGEGVIDRLRQLGYSNVVEVGFGITPINPKYTNKRAEMWGLMADWLKRGQIPKDNKLISDLTAPRYYYDAANRIALEKKEHIKQRIGCSPDMGDSLALTFAFPVRSDDKKSSKQNDYKEIGDSDSDSWMAY